MWVLVIFLLVIIACLIALIVFLLREQATLEDTRKREERYRSDLYREIKDKEQLYQWLIDYAVQQGAVIYTGDSQVTIHFADPTR